MAWIACALLREQCIHRDRVVEYLEFLDRQLFIAPHPKICLGDLYLRLDVLGGDHHEVQTGVSCVFCGLQFVDPLQTGLVYVVSFFVSCDLKREKYGW